MAHTPTRSLFTFFGFVIWGDIADLTAYRNRKGKFVLFAKTWPHKPPSPAQLAQRQRITNAAAGWRALSPATRQQWHLAARRASLCAHGYHVFVHWHLTGDDLAIQTLERQTGTELLP